VYLLILVLSDVQFVFAISLVRFCYMHSLHVSYYGGWAPIHSGYLKICPKTYDALIVSK